MTTPDTIERFDTDHPELFHPKLAGKSAPWSPAVESEREWWDTHVSYWKIKRYGQGLSLVCASFENPKAKGNIILVTGWSECFLKYATLIRELYKEGFSVHTYDHQSQGLSDRNLPDSPQSTFVHNFQDYVDDFTHFAEHVKANSSNKGNNINGSSSSSSNKKQLDTFLVAHSMGGLVTAIAMSTNPSLVQRAVLCAPMFRNKCGMKALEYRYPLPQVIAYWVTWAACYAGLGTMHALGYFTEEPTDKLPLNLTTSCELQLRDWQRLRAKYPEIMSTCVTNDWVKTSIEAQKTFSRRYNLVATNTLILSAENDHFVHNRAMAMYVEKNKNCQMFCAPDSCHELFFEKEKVRGACLAAVKQFFTNASHDVLSVTNASPLTVHDKSKPLYSSFEQATRIIGYCIGTAGCLIGIIMMASGGGNARRR